MVLLPWLNSDDVVQLTMLMENRVTEGPKKCSSKSQLNYCSSSGALAESKLTHLTHFCCCCSVIQLCLTLCDPMDCSMPGFPVLRQLQEFAQIHVHWVSDAIQSYCPLSSFPLLPSIFPSIRGFSNKSVLCIRWPVYWSFSISPSTEYSGLISFRIDWFDLLAVQGTLKSLHQHHSSKGSILWCSAFFIV